MVIEPQNRSDKSLLGDANERFSSSGMLESIIGGKSVIDTTHVSIADTSAAKAFIRAYGFDPDDVDDSQTILDLRERALRYVSQKLLPYQGLAEVPPKYYDMSIEDYLLEATLSAPGSWPNWSCVLLKVIHCAAHALYTHDTEAHAAALVTIKKRFLPFISETDGQKWFGDAGRKIKLVTFEIKDQKGFSRTMTKLLHKPGNLAYEIFDRLGVRFVVNDIHSVVLLIDFLRSRNITMYANNLPERTRNSLAEFERLLGIYHDINSNVSAPETSSDESVLVKPKMKNPSSHHEFEALQFTERLMVNLKSGRRTVFPYEVQILDKKSWEKSQIGDASHSAYEHRQIERVRQRLFIGAPNPADDP